MLWAYLYVKEYWLNIDENFITTYQGVASFLTTHLGVEGFITTYLGVAGLPLFPALPLEPILSIQVPQLCWLPPYTNPVFQLIPASTLNPSSVMCSSIAEPAFRSLNLTPEECLCRASCITVDKGCTCNRFIEVCYYLFIVHIIYYFIIYYFYY